MKISDLVTKDKKEISFNRVEDSEGDNNRGWQVDKLVAIVDGKEAGYLKMSYIPDERFRRYYPSILNYWFQIAGKCWIDIDRRTTPYQKLSDKELITCLSNMDGWPYDRGDYEKMSHKELVTAVELKIQKIMRGKEGEQFKKFKAYHVNNPHVDYIDVEKDFRRFGIGTALYIEGAKWMKLYASTLQQPNAKAAWEKFTNNGQTGNDRRGMYLIV